METLNCKSCNSPLIIREGAETFPCPHCGKWMSAQRTADGTIKLAKLHPLRDLILRIYCHAVIFLILYVLSTGPMYWLIYEAFNMGDFWLLTYIYWPIAFACQNEVISQWFTWYVGLWVF